MENIRFDAEHFEDGNWYQAEASAEGVSPRVTARIDDKPGDDGSPAADDKLEFLNELDDLFAALSPVCAGRLFRLIVTNPGAQGLDGGKLVTRDWFQVKAISGEPGRPRELVLASPELQDQLGAVMARARKLLVNGGVLSEGPQIAGQLGDIAKILAAAKSAGFDSPRVEIVQDGEHLEIAVKGTKDGKDVAVSRSGKVDETLTFLADAVAPPPPAPPAPQAAPAAEAAEATAAPASG